MKGKIKLVVGLLFATAVVVQATPITAGLYVELIADDITGVADGASVTGWDDTQGNVSLATYGGYTAPVFVSSDANFNNHSTVSFNHATLRDITLGGTAPSTENMTVFMVARYNAQPNATPEWLFQSQVKVGNNNNNRFRIARSGTGYLNSAYQTRVGGGGGLATANGSGRSTDLTLFNVRSGGNVVNLDVITAGGTISDTGGNGNGRNWARIVLGNSGNNKNYANANIAEMLVYDHALTTAEIAQVNDYLVAKYAIPEPATLGLIAVMAGGLIFVRRRIMM